MIGAIAAPLLAKIATGAALALLLAVGVQTWRLDCAQDARDAALERVGKAEAQRDAARVERDETVRANAQLATALQMQGEEVMRLAAEGKARAARAAAAAKAAARPFQPPAGHGPKSLNEWLRGCCSP